MAQPLELEDPVKVGGHRLRGRLGAGGMGVVYLAGEPGSYVAVKTMRAADVADEGIRARFRAEIAHARRAGSPHTPQVIADGSDAPVPYLVTEFIDGPSLAAVVRRDGPLDQDALHAVALGVAGALASIHDAGVVHRDVKPSNVLLATEGPKVIDFGIARQAHDAERLTQTGIVMGSPGWIAPERLTGGPATAASDVFCWGMLVAYAASGRHPFGGDAEHTNERIMTLSPQLAGLTGPLKELVEAALAKDPAERPSADGLVGSLLSPGAEETSESAVQRLWTPLRRRRIPHKRVIAGVGVVVAVHAVAGFWSFHGSRSPAPQAAPTQAVTVLVSATPEPTTVATAPAATPSSSRARPLSAPDRTDPAPASPGKTRSVKSAKPKAGSKAKSSKNRK